MSKTITHFVIVNGVKLKIYTTLYTDKAPISAISHDPTYETDRKLSEDVTSFKAEYE